MHGVRVKCPLCFLSDFNQCLNSSTISRGIYKKLRKFVRWFSAFYIRSDGRTGGLEYALHRVAKTLKQVAWKNKENV